VVTDADELVGLRTTCERQLDANTATQTALAKTHATMVSMSQNNQSLVSGMDALRSMVVNIGKAAHNRAGPTKREVKKRSRDDGERKSDVVTIDDSMDTAVQDIKMPHYDPSKPPIDQSVLALKAVYTAIKKYKYLDAIAAVKEQSINAYKNLYKEKLKAHIIKNPNDVAGVRFEYPPWRDTCTFTQYYIVDLFLSVFPPTRIPTDPHQPRLTFSNPRPTPAPLGQLSTDEANLKEMYRKHFDPVLWRKKRQQRKKQPAKKKTKPNMETKYDGNDAPAAAAGDDDDNDNDDAANDNDDDDDNEPPKPLTELQLFAIAHSVFHANAKRAFIMDAGTEEAKAKLVDDAKKLRLHKRKIRVSLHTRAAHVHTATTYLFHAYLCVCVCVLDVGESEREVRFLAKASIDNGDWQTSRQGGR